MSQQEGGVLLIQLHMLQDCCVSPSTSARSGGGNSDFLGRQLTSEQTPQLRWPRVFVLYRACRGPPDTPACRLTPGRLDRVRLPEVSSRGVAGEVSLSPGPPRPALVGQAVVSFARLVPARLARADVPTPLLLGWRRP